ncbi:hypothetical protein K1719_038816 [Acacia pycnantha]|nr:hypothetical protein K1719_038816 [Acacia pycnantha]
MDKSWIKLPRSSPVYLAGLNTFLDFASSHLALMARSCVLVCDVHGEQRGMGYELHLPRTSQVGNQVHQDDPVNEAIRDAFGVQDDNFTAEVQVPEPVFFRNDAAREFFSLMDESDRPLYQVRKGKKQKKKPAKILSHQHHLSPLKTLRPPAPSHCSQHPPERRNCVYKSRRQCVMDIRIDEGTGRTVYNSGLRSKVVIQEGSAQEYMNRYDDPQTKFIPNEKEMRISMGATSTAVEGSRRIQFHEEGFNACEIPSTYTAESVVKGPAVCHNISVFISTTENDSKL